MKQTDKTNCLKAQNNALKDENKSLLNCIRKLEVKLSKVNRYTIKQMDTETLEEAAIRTTDRRKLAMINEELKARRELKVDRPLTIEDFLG